MIKDSKKANLFEIEEEDENEGAGYVDKEKEEEKKKIANKLLVDSDDEDEFKPTMRKPSAI